MVARIRSMKDQFKDSENRRRLNALQTNFSKLTSSFSRQDCIPDFEDSKNKLKPRFDVIFADFGYNVDQLGDVEGLSYMGRMH